MNLSVLSMLKVALGIALVMILVLGYKVANKTTNSIEKTIEKTVNPPMEVIVSSVLDGIREQNRVIVFTAGYVSTVTAKKTRFFMDAQKTFIIPGRIRYEIDYGKMSSRNLEWDSTTGELRVTLPPLEVSKPEFDITREQEYSSGALMAFTDAEKDLDQANKIHATNDMMKQAKQPEMMALAKDAARRATQHNFSIPLQAAGIKTKVLVRFPGEEFKGGDPQFMDRSRDAKQVYSDKSVGAN